MQQPRYLVDTHIPIGLYTRGGLERFPAKVQKILTSPHIQLLLSVVSQMEIAAKHSIGKLNFPEQHLTAVCINAGIDMFSLEEHHTRRLFDLPLHHRDPFDRALIATALSEELPVITSDAAFRQYRGLQIIWE